MYYWDTSVCTVCIYLFCSVSFFVAEVSEGKRVRGWVPRKLLEMLESPQEAMTSNCPKKDRSADGNHGDRTEQNHSTHNKGGDGRNVANSSVASKDGKKKKKKAHHKKHD